MNYGKEEVRRLLQNRNNAGKKMTNRVFLHLLKIVFLVIVLGACVAGSFAMGTIKGIIDTSPEPESLTVTPLGIASGIYDANGNLKESLVKSGANREPVAYSEIPQDLINAFVAIEDERFWTHEGVDIRGVLRSMASLLLSGRIESGASTITQQLIKNNVFEGGMERGWGARFIRKFQEQYLALRLDKEVSKEDILINYLNTINLGQNSLGVQVASQRYFGKNVSELNLSECAALAGITQNPYRYNPITFPENNAVRRLSVLNHMEDQGYITAEQKAEALADTEALYERIRENNLVIQEQKTPYTYFTDAVITEVLNDLQTELGYSEADAYTMLYSGGLHIYTTQNSDFQRVLDEEVNNPANYPESAFQWSFSYTVNATLADGRDVTYTENHVKRTLNLSTLVYDSQEEIEEVIAAFKETVFGAHDVVADEKITYTLQPQLAAIIMDQYTGQVLAISGGRGDKAFSRSMNRATQTYRSPGSTFKILTTFAPALDIKGQTLSSVQQDLPFSYQGFTMKNWWPSNMWLGNCTARQAIVYSMNVVSANFLVNTVGIETGFEYAEKFGISSLVREKEIGGRIYSDLGPSLCLGGLTNGANLLDVTGAFAAIADQGTYREPIFYTKITDHEGNVILEKSQDVHQVIQPSTAYLLTSAMADSMKDGSFKQTYFKPSSMSAALNNRMTAAGKSGTATDNAGKDRDYWFIGYTPYYSMGVWSGFDDGSIPLQDNVEMNNYHKTVWKAVMDRIHAGREVIDFPVPDDIRTAKVCSLSGKLAVPGVCEQDPNCQVYEEYYAAGTVPSEYCSIHAIIHMCSQTHEEANAYCPRTYDKLYYLMPMTDVITLDSEYIYRPGSSPAKCTEHEAPEPPPTLPRTTEADTEEEEPTEEGTEGFEDESETGGTLPYISPTAPGGTGESETESGAPAETLPVP
ncbi:MAG: penicillin-binding protein [Lachnospiraceae bacterium]|nr:penicillin-binding protein [Lachnospiraceae bacterium]